MQYIHLLVASRNQAAPNAALLRARRIFSSSVIKHPVIPWNLEQRRRVLAHAYEELKEEVERWEKITAHEREWGAPGQRTPSF